MYTLNTKPIKRSIFTKEEDEKLIELVKRYGDDPKSWKPISKKMRTKNPRRCRERWFKYLHSNALMWNNNEDEIVLEKYEKLGPEWTKIAGFLPGKNSVQVKNRFMNLNSNKTNDIQIIVNDISNSVNNMQQSNSFFISNNQEINNQDNQIYNDFEIDLFDDNSLKRLFDSLNNTNSNFSNQNNFLEKQ